MPIQVSLWGSTPKLPWEERLDYASDSAIERTGMSREELKKLLQYLEDLNIIP